MFYWANFSNPAIPTSHQNTALRLVVDITISFYCLFPVSHPFFGLSVWYLPRLTWYALWVVHKDHVTLKRTRFWRGISLDWRPTIYFISNYSLLPLGIELYPKLDGANVCLIFVHSLCFSFQNVLVEYRGRWRVPSILHFGRAWRRLKIHSGWVAMSHWKEAKSRVRFSLGYNIDDDGG